MSITSGSCRVLLPKLPPPTPYILVHPQHLWLALSWRRVNIYIKRQLSYAQFVCVCVCTFFFHMRVVRMWLHLTDYEKVCACINMKLCIGVARALAVRCDGICVCVCLLNSHSFALTLYTCISYLHPHHLLNLLAHLSRLFHHLKYWMMSWERQAEIRIARFHFQNRKSVLCNRKISVSRRTPGRKYSTSKMRNSILQNTIPLNSFNPTFYKFFLWRFLLHTWLYNDLTEN